MRAIGLWLALLAAGGCATTPPAPPTGRWGGYHVAMTLDAAGGTVEYDCASGRIDQPLLPDAAGRFHATGSHVPGTGGPAQIGYSPPRYAAIYTGQLRGDVMLLTVRVPERGFVIGPYRLQRGADGNLMRCL